MAILNDSSDFRIQEAAVVYFMSLFSPSSLHDIMPLKNAQKKTHSTEIINVFSELLQVRF